LSTHLIIVILTLCSSKRSSGIVYCSLRRHEILRRLIGPGKRHDVATWRLSKQLAMRDGAGDLSDASFQGRKESAKKEVISRSQPFFF
jgi:hypothetical protein